MSALIWHGVKVFKTITWSSFYGLFCLIPRMYQHVNILDPRGDILGPIYTVRFLSHATTAYDRPTTWFTIVEYVKKKCRSILKHVLKRCDNHKSCRRPVVRLTKIVSCKSSLTDLVVLVLCNVHNRSHLLNEQQEQITLLEGGKLWFSPLTGEGLEPIVLPWKCHSGHIMELCDECNYCTEFQFYTEKNRERYSIFCDFTPLCVPVGTSQNKKQNQNQECCHQPRSQDLSSSLPWKGRRETLATRLCYHNEVNAILHHSESSFEQDNKKFRVMGTLIIGTMQV